MTPSVVMMFAALALVAAPDFNAIGNLLMTEAGNQPLHITAQAAGSSPQFHPLNINPD